MVRAFLLLVAVFLVACDGNGSDPAPQTDATVDAPESGGSVEPTAEDEPTEPDEDTRQDDDVRQEIADTLKGFTEAFLNGEIVKLATFWSDECSEEDIDAINGAVVLAAGFIGGEAELLVDADKLIVEELSNRRVSVPGDADQPEGTYEILIDGRPLPDADAEEDDQAIVFVLESGVWRIANCDALAAGFES